MQNSSSAGTCKIKTATVPFQQNKIAKEKTQQSEKEWLLPPFRYYSKYLIPIFSQRDSRSAIGILDKIYVSKIALGRI